MIQDLTHINALKDYLLIWWSLLLLSCKLIQPNVKGFTLILDVFLGYTWETYAVCWPRKNCLVCLCLWSNGSHTNECVFIGLVVLVTYLPLSILFPCII